MSALADLGIIAAGYLVLMAVGLVRRPDLAGRFGRGRGVDAGGGQPVADGVAGPPLHHLVAIAAAVDAVIAEPHRIVGISAPPHRVPAWANAGAAPTRSRWPMPLVHKRTDGP